MKTRRNDDRRSRRSKGGSQPEGGRRPPGPRMVREDWTWEEKRFREIISAYRARGGASSSGPLPLISAGPTA